MAGGRAGAYAPHPLVVATGLAAILGHVFPVYLRFKGGKAVATSAGFFLAVAPLAVGVAAVLWGIVFALRRYVSLASITAAVALPVAVCLTRPAPFAAGIYLTAMSIVGALLVIYLHRANIRRLLAGKELRIGAGKAHHGDTENTEDTEKGGDRP